LKNKTPYKRIYEIKIKVKDDNKCVSLGTSKTNYDPRISVAWSYKYDVPLDKVFLKLYK
jgi:hypothetical protein